MLRRIEEQIENKDRNQVSDCGLPHHLLVPRWVIVNAIHDPWNNGKEVPRWGVAEIQKMSPSTTGRCSRHAANQLERGTATRQPITQTYYIWRAGVVGKTIFDIRRPDMVERIGSYLPPKFPLFYDAITQSDIEAWFVSDPKVSKMVEKALF